jgi:hypothetical protein
MRLKLHYDKLLATFAFKLNLRRYTVLLWEDFADVSKAKDVSGDGSAFSISGGGGGDFGGEEYENVVGADEINLVGRCRLTVSKSVLIAPMVAALEATIRLIAFKLCFQFKLAPLSPGVCGGDAGHDAAHRVPGAGDAARWTREAQLEK